MTERKKQPKVHPLRRSSSLKLSAVRSTDFFAERRSQADIDTARRLLRRRGGQPPDMPDQLVRERTPPTSHGPTLNNNV